MIGFVIECSLKSSKAQRDKKKEIKCIEKVCCIDFELKIV